MKNNSKLIIPNAKYLVTSATRSMLSRDIIGNLSQLGKPFLVVSFVVAVLVMTIEGIFI